MTSLDRFTPLSNPVSIQEAVAAFGQVKADAAMQALRNELLNLPIGELVPVVDLLRALPRLTAADAQGRQFSVFDVVRIHTGRLCSDYLQAQRLRAIVLSGVLGVLGRAVVGMSFYLEALDNLATTRSE